MGESLQEAESSAIYKGAELSFGGNGCSIDYNLILKVKAQSKARRIATGGLQWEAER